VIFPISKGIEKVNLVLLPLLFVIVLGLAIYAATLDNVGAGYAFYLKPDFSALSVAVVIAAIGQAFFSLSLGQGAMMTYASYLSRKTSLAENASIIAGSTLVFAFTCGFMIFPMLAAFDLLNTGAAGLDLILGPLPRAFAGMGEPVGNIVGFLFFAGTFFAAFTSAVSLTEPAIAYTAEERGWDRRRAAILVCTLIYVAGIAVALSKPLLDLEGGLVTDTAVILGGLGIALYVGWFREKGVAKADMDASEGGWKLSWYTYPLVRYVMPGVLVVLLFFALLGTPCALSGDAAAGGLFERIFDVRIVGCTG
jgi:NSS family neurotransmitter:Na+ symporter